jgi:hypothetical protein
LADVPVDIFVGKRGIDLILQQVKSSELGEVTMLDMFSSEGIRLQHTFMQSSWEGIGRFATILSEIVLLLEFSGFGGRENCATNIKRRRRLLGFYKHSGGVIITASI